MGTQITLDLDAEQFLRLEKMQELRNKGASFEDRKSLEFVAVELALFGARDIQDANARDGHKLEEWFASLDKFRDCLLEQMDEYKEDGDDPPCDRVTIIMGFDQLKSGEFPSSWEDNLFGIWDAMGTFPDRDHYQEQLYKLVSWLWFVETTSETDGMELPPETDDTELPSGSNGKAQ